MHITFHGAARQVTGSMHLITLDNGYKILLDCGLNYQQKRELHADAFEFPFRPQDIDAVIVSHAHIDHSGNIPKLVADGFTGKIICTPATLELMRFLLFDSANIQLSEYKQRLSRATKHRRTLIAPPIYSDKDVEKALDQVVTLQFNKTVEILPGVTIELIEAGHLLGAASIVLSCEHAGKTTRIGFSGDIGRRYAELIRTPTLMQNIDYLITETTYGGRKHRCASRAEEELLNYFDEVQRIKGRLVIPAFSVGRTQSIIFVLHKLYVQGKLPPVKVFVDSPLAVRSTHVYEQYASLLNEDAKAFIEEHGSLFDFENLELIEDYEDHEKLMYYTEPCIIISAAGMVEGGRIQEHVKSNIQNPFSTILIAGYCAEGTLGHRLLQGQKNIRMGGRDYQIYCKIAQTDVFSSHPDQDEIFEYITKTYHANMKKIFLVHGDGNNLDAMQELLQANGVHNVHIPEMGERVELV
jgi:metallo-beta-lactamase family protein